MTYAEFLLVFLALPIIALLALLVRRGGLRRFHLVAGGLVCLIAFVYTTPWDNYAAAHHLWTFDPAFVWGPPLWLGALPLEEYLFYLAEALFVCLVLVTLARYVPGLGEAPVLAPPAPNNGGAGRDGDTTRGVSSSGSPIIGGGGGLNPEDNT